MFFAVCLNVFAVSALFSSEFNCLEPEPDVFPETPYYLQVTRVIKGSASEKAGILTGDRVVCIDGLRVFSMDEYVIVRFMNDTAEDIPLKIIRDGKEMDVRVTSPKPVRRGGYYMSERKKDFLNILVQWNVFPFSNPESGKPKALPETLDKNFRKWVEASAFFTNQGLRAAKKPLSVESILTWFPVRAQAAVAGVLKTKKDHNTRVWIKRLLEVYLLLRRSQYDQASAWISEGALSGKSPDPFLGRLLAFYQRVILHQSPGAGKDIVALLACTPETFLLCYPFPVEITGDSRNVFGFDPEFQKAYNASINTQMPLPKEVNDLSIEYIRRSMKARNETDRYMLQVRAALINPGSYGRWLHRSYLIRNKSTRLNVYEGLKKRWTEQPGEQVLTAFGLACVSLLETDWQVFEKACRKIQAGGAAETARLYATLYEMARRSRRRISWDMITEKIRTISGEATLPTVYRTLSGIVPDSDAVLSCGVYDREQRRIISFAEYVEKNKSRLARCLRHTPVSDTDARVTDAVTNGNAKTRKELATLLSRDIAYYPTQHTFDLFLQLAGSTPRDHIFDCMCFFIGYHFCTQQKNPINVSQIPHYFQPMEYLHYENIYKQLQKVNPSDPTFDSFVAESLKKAGAPSVYLLIATKLRKAGKTRRARQLTEKVVNFYESLTGAYDGNNFLWNALRDFASVPGFTEQARPYNKGFVQKRLYYDSAFVLSAILSSYEEDSRRVVSQLKKSVGRRVQKDSGQYIYGGNVYTDVADLRRDFVLDLEKKEILRHSHLRELKRNSRLAYIFTRAGTDKEKTIRVPPSHAPGSRPVKKKQLPARSDIVLRVNDRFATLEWIATRDGDVLSHNRKTGDVVYYKQGLPYVLFADFNVNQLLPLKRRVWVASNHGLFALIRKKGKWSEIAVNASEVDVEVTELSARDNLLTVTYDKAKKAVLDVEKNKWK